MSEYAVPGALVETAWLADHLDDPDVVVVDIHLDATTYTAGHIPGAVGWHAVGTLVAADYRTNFDPSHVAAMLGSAGITNDTTVVVTSEHSGLAPWAYWYLKVVGHDDVRVLDGGHRKWVAEDRPLTAELTRPDAVTYAVGSLDERGRAGLDDVMAAAAAGEGVLLDVRTPEEFEGEIFLLAPPADGERAGHIPGARHLYYEQALDEDGTFRDVEALAALYQDAGVSPDDRVITYCAVGMRAGHTWFVLTQLLGYANVANYDRSWNEWGRRPDTPIEATGTDR